MLALLSVRITIPRPRAWDVRFRAARVVPDSSPVFRYVIEGNLLAIKKLFDSGDASAFDIDASTQTSALVVSHHAHIEIFVTDIDSMPLIEGISKCGDSFSRLALILARRQSHISRVS